MTLREVWESWRKFWFEPKSITPLALFRILMNILIFQCLAIHIGPDFLTWYGVDAVLPLEAVKEFFWQNEPRFDAMLLLPADNNWYVGYFITILIATVFSIIGLFTKYSTFYVWIGLLSLNHHDPFNMNGGDTFLRMTSLFLALSPCGEAWSVDNLIKRKRGIPTQPIQNPWAWRMIQLQLAIAYCDTFWCKIIGEQWQSGTAVYFATRLDDMYRFDIPFLFDSIWFCKFLTWSTLVIEFSMWTFVWFREIRYWVLLAALGLHLGIDLAMNLPVFEWAFIACLVTFIYPEDLERWKDWLMAMLARKPNNAASMVEKVEKVEKNENNESNESNEATA